MQTFNQLFFKKKQIFSYFFKEISEMNIVMIVLGKLCGKRRGVSTDRLLLGMTSGLATGQS